MSELTRSIQEEQDNTESVQAPPKVEAENDTGDREDSRQRAVRRWRGDQLKKLVAISFMVALVCAASPAMVALAATTACGTLTVYAGGPTGDPKYLLTITSGGTATQYRLAGNGTAPADLGDLFVAKTLQLITINGTQVTTNTGSPQAINLVDFTVTRVTSCVLPNTSSETPAHIPLASVLLAGALILFAVAVLRRSPSSTGPRGV